MATMWRGGGHGGDVTGNLGTSNKLYRSLMIEAQLFLFLFRFCFVFTIIIPFYSLLILRKVICENVAGVSYAE